KGGSNAALAHQLLCLAMMSSGQPWAQGWIHNLMSDIAKHAVDPTYQPFNPADPIGIDKFILSYIPPIFTYPDPSDSPPELILDLGITTKDVGAVLGGYGHFLNELLPGFIQNAASLHAE